MFDYDLFLECLEDHLVELAGSYTLREFIYTVSISWCRPGGQVPVAPLLTVIKDIGSKTIYSCVCLYDGAMPVYSDNDGSEMVFHNRLKEMMSARQVADTHCIRNILFGTYATARDYFEASLCAGLEMQKTHPDKAKVDSLLSQAGRFRQKKHMPPTPISQISRANYMTTELFHN